MNLSLRRSLQSAAVVSTLAALSFAATSSVAMDVRRESLRTAGTKTQVVMEVDVAGSSKPGNALDILFVVDDSGSMQVHQANLLANVGDLVRAAVSSGVDVHAGVVSTNMDSAPWNPPPGISYQGRLSGAVKKFAATQDGDFAQVLTDNLKLVMNTNGSATETPFAAAIAAVTEPLASAENQGFLRKNAALAIFVLTDADDQSQISVPDFVQTLKALKGKAPVTLHAAYIPKASTTCDRSGENLPERLEEALTAFGTLADSFNLCEAFGPKLRSIGEEYVSIGLSSVQLKLEPELSTVKVVFGSQTFWGGDLYSGWVYDSKKMQLLFGADIDWTLQPTGTRLKIEYYAK